MSEPSIFTGEHRGSWFAGILHLDRRVDVSFSPKGKSVRVWIDDEEVSAAPAIKIERGQACDQEPTDAEIDATAEELHAQTLVTDYADAEPMTREAMRSDALRILRAAAEARRGAHGRR